MLVKDLIPESQYETKCPYSMDPKGICIHNTANDATAKNERDNVAKPQNQDEVSFHVAIDDVEAIQVIPFNRNAWHAGDGGNGEGNRNYIAIEICYSKSGGDRFINAEKRAAKEVAALLKQYGWGIDKVKKHQDFSGKYCPHRTLDMGWQRFLNMIQVELNADNQKIHVGEYLNVKPFNAGFGIFKDDSSWETWNRITYLGCPISAQVLDNPRKNVYKVKDCRYGFEGYCYIENNNNTTFTPYQAYIEKKETKEALFKVVADGKQVSDTCKAKWIPGIIDEQLKKGTKDIKVVQCN